MGILRRHTDAAAEYALDAADEGERMSDELRRYAPDMESLMERMQSMPRAARDELERRMGQMRQGFDDARDAAYEQAQLALDTTEGFVRREPWKALAIVAAVGALLGIVLARSTLSED